MLLKGDAKWKAVFEIGLQPGADPGTEPNPYTQETKESGIGVPP